MTYEQHYAKAMYELAVKEGRMAGTTPKFAKYRRGQLGEAIVATLTRPRTSLGIANTIGTDPANVRSAIKVLMRDKLISCDRHNGRPFKYFRATKHTQEGGV